MEENKENKLKTYIEIFISLKKKIKGEKTQKEYKEINKIEIVKKR